MRLKIKLFFWVPTILLIMSFNNSFWPISDSTGEEIGVEHIIIEADRRPLKMKEGHLTKEIVTEEDFSSANASGVDDILNSIQGVTTSGGPRTFLELPQIRGMEGDKLLLMIDGTKQNYRTHHSGGPALDPSLLKQVEVVKSSASSRYGSGAMGGVVSYTTKDGDDFLKKGENWGGRLSTAFHSGNQEKGVGTTFYSRQQKSDQLIHLHKRDSKNIRQGRGSSLPYSGQDDFLLLSKLGYKVNEEKNIKFSYERQKNRFVIPLSDTATSLSSSIASSSPLETSRDKALRQTYLVKLNNNQKNSKRREELNFYRTTVESEKIRSTDGRVDQRQLTTYALDFTQNNKMGDSGQSIDLIYGMEFLHEEQEGSRNRGNLSSYPRGHGQIGGAFIESTFHPKDSWLITPALRYDQYQQKSSQMSGGKKQGHSLSKSLKNEWPLFSHFTFWLTYSEGFNIPRIEQLFPSGYHFNVGGANNFLPNPDLKAEKAKHYELGSKWQKESLIFSDDLITLSYQLYQKDVNDYIEGKLSFANRSTQFINRDFVRFRGHEVSLSLDHPFFSTQIGYVMVRAKKKEGAYLSTAPADEINWSLCYFINGPKRKIGYEGKKVFSQNRLDSSDETPVYKTAGYLLHHLFLGYSFQDKWDLMMRMNNIFDIKYRRHTSYNYEMGRDLRLVLTYQL